MTDLRQSQNYASYMEKIGWRVEKLPDGQVFIKKLPLFGSIIKIQRPSKINFSQIDNLAKKHRALFVKIEPNLPFDNGTIEQFNNHGYQLSRSPLLPTKTLQIDLTQSEDKIFSQFKKDARYEIRKAEKNKLKISILSGACGEPTIDNFISLWHQNAWSRGFWIPIRKQIKSLWEAFNQNAYLLTASHYDNTYYRSKIIAGALIVIHSCVAHYSYAASSPKGRQLSAPSLVVWEAIKLAKSKNCRIFDFEGIYDERFPNKKWLGFTHFKKSFGGQELEYPGCFTKFFFPFFPWS